MPVEFCGLPIIRAPGRSGGSTTWTTVAEEAGQEVTRARRATRVTTANAGYGGKILATGSCCTLPSDLYAVGTMHSITRECGGLNTSIAAAPTRSNHPAASRGSSNGSETSAHRHWAHLPPSTAQQSGPGGGGHQGSWEVGSEHDHSNIEISYSLPCAVMRLLPSSCTGNTPGPPWDTTTRLRSCMTDTCTETWIHTAATSMLSNRSLHPRPLPPARSPKSQIPHLVRRPCIV